MDGETVTNYVADDSAEGEAAAAPSPARPRRQSGRVAEGGAPATPASGSSAGEAGAHAQGAAEGTSSPNGSSPPPVIVEGPVQVLGGAPPCGGVFL